MTHEDSAHAHGADQYDGSESWMTAVKVLQDASPITIPEGASAMTVHVEWEPGDSGTPPHRHSGPAFGHVIEGAVRFEPDRGFVVPGGRTPHVPASGRTTALRRDGLVLSRNP
ncbi:hypothetical protein [Streptomyces sp. NPDC057545]|uniref:hypothetical protein n=1 Tax=Streptomyces sp. NPDC057545 TaxID=3346164 RepID=UPI0036A0DE16